MPTPVAKPSGGDAFAEMARAQRAANGHLEPTHDTQGNVVLFAPECPVKQVSNNKDELVVNVFALFDSKGRTVLSQTRRQDVRQFLVHE